MEVIIHLWILCWYLLNVIHSLSALLDASEMLGSSLEFATKSHVKLICQGILDQGALFGVEAIDWMVKQWENVKGKDLVSFHTHKAVDFSARDTNIIDTLKTRCGNLSNRSNNVPP